MKKSIILAIALVMSVATFAQQLATLNHNDSITAYYGMNALQQAHSAAVNGDIITLSSGIFNSVNITKAVTIRGAGAWVDTNSNSNTILYNSFSLNVPADSVHHLTFEGLYFMNAVEYTEVHNPSFNKCHFSQFNFNTGGNMYNAIATNCIIESWTNYYTTNTGWCAQGTQFVNSILLNSGDQDPCSFVNCIVHQHPQTVYITQRLFQNCILYGSYGYMSQYMSGNGSTSFNCMYVNSSVDNLYSDTPNHVLWNKIGMSTVFKNFDGTYGSTTTFELQDSIAANYLGTDGTQIGIYGGTHPFSPKVTSPVIKSINVAQRNNSQGKLEVNIEMVTEEE